MHRVAFASPGDDAPPGTRVRHFSWLTALVIGLSLVVAVPEDDDGGQSDVLVRQRD